MTDSKIPKAAEIQAKNAADAIPEGELDKATGGIVVRKAGERPIEYLTIQIPPGPGK